MKWLFILLTFLYVNLTIAQVTPFTLALRIDSSTSIKHKYFQKVPELGKRNLNSIFNKVLVTQDSLINKEFTFKQQIKYNPSTIIKLTFYFKIQTFSYKEMLSEFNDFAQIYYDYPDLLDSNKCEQMFGTFLQFHFVLDSVKVTSSYKNFNKNFKKYIEQELYYVQNLKNTTTLFSNKKVDVLSIKVINANNDENMDILVNDIRGEKIANSLTDFWIYSSKKRDFIYVKQLSAPIWNIDLKQRIFYSGWHMSAFKSNEWRFKIIGNKAVTIK